MKPAKLAVIFALVSGSTSTVLSRRLQEMDVEHETLCASFKMYAFDRPDIAFLNRKRRNGKIPAVDPDPAWEMVEIRGSEGQRTAKRQCSSTDKSEIVECCFVKGKPVELTVTEGRSKCVGLLGPVDPDMPVELLDKIASKMMACDNRKSLNPPISVFGRTVKKEWRNLTRKWRDRRTYKIESWGAEEDTQDMNKCYDVVGLPAAKGKRLPSNKRIGFNFADAMSWHMMRPDGSVICGSKDYRHNGSIFRGRVTECCNIAGRETILRLEDDSWNKIGWGSGYIRFMDLKVHHRKSKEEINQLQFAQTLENVTKDIVFMWGDLKSFKAGRRQANRSDSNEPATLPEPVPGPVPAPVGFETLPEPETRPEPIETPAPIQPETKPLPRPGPAETPEPTVETPETKPLPPPMPEERQQPETRPMPAEPFGTVEEFCGDLVAHHGESVCEELCAELKTVYEQMLPEGMLDVCDGTGMTIAAVCPDNC